MVILSLKLRRTNLTEPTGVYEVVLLRAIETDGGIPLEAGDVGHIVGYLGPDYIVEFAFNEDDPTGGVYDTACVSPESCAIIETR